MIRAVIGLPGNGKTLFLVSKIIEELVYTDRYVVTNCHDLLLGRLNEYIAEKYPDLDPLVDLEKRLLVIPKEETHVFFRYRAGGLTLPYPVEKTADGKKLRREEFLEGMVPYFLKLTERPEWMTPCTYFITEAHDAFNADDWADCGRAVQYYCSKHRHLHDELILETQLFEQMDAKMRRLVQETHEMVNNYMRSVGIFKKRGGFERRVFYKEKKGNAEPFQVVEFKLDAKGVASCYKTTGALGIMSRGAEQKGFGRARGLPWWSLWVGAALLCVAAGAVAAVVPKLFGKGLSAMVTQTEKGVREGFGVPQRASEQGSGAKGAPVSGDGVPPREVVAGSSTRIGSSGKPSAHPPAASSQFHNVTPSPAMGGQILVTGVVRTPWKITVTLSDGRTLTELDGVLERVERNFVELKDGTRYGYAKAVSRGEFLRSQKTSPEKNGNSPSEETRLDQDNENLGAEKSAWLPADRYGVRKLREKETLPQVTTR